MFPKAILLDTDDTIIAFDYGVDLDRCWRMVCSKHLQFKEGQTEQVIAQIRKQAKWFWSDPERHRIGRMDLDKARTAIVSAALQDLHFSDVSVTERIAVEYGIVRDDAVTLYPGAIETLQFLREKGIKLALITNGKASMQRKKIERFQLAPFFQTIIIEEEFGVGKPEPEVYLHAMKQLNVNPNETWMVGDNLEWEVIAPQQLGIKSIWINPRGLEVPTSIVPFKTIRILSDMIRLFD